MNNLYKVDLPEADIPPEVLMALLGIKEVQADYDVRRSNHNGNFDQEWYSYHCI